MLSLITTWRVFLQSVRSLLTFNLVLWETAYAQFVVIKAIFLWIIDVVLFEISHKHAHLSAASRCKTLQTNFIQRNKSKCMFKKQNKQVSINKNMPLCLWGFNTPTIKAISYTVQTNISTKKCLKKKRNQVCVKCTMLLFSKAHNSKQGKPANIRGSGTS